MHAQKKAHFSMIHRRPDARPVGVWYHKGVAACVTYTGIISVSFHLVSMQVLRSLYGSKYTGHGQSKVRSPVSKRNEPCHKGRTRSVRASTYTNPAQLVIKHVTSYPIKGFNTAQGS